MRASNHSDAWTDSTVALVLEAHVGISKHLVEEGRLQHEPNLSSFFSFSVDRLKRDPSQNAKKMNMRSVTRP